MFIYLLLFGLEIVTIPIYVYEKKLYLIINGTCLWLLMAYRNYSVGVDTSTYKSFFYQFGMYNVNSTLRNWFFPFHARFENGFIFLNHIVYNISPNFQLMIMVTSAIMIVCFTFFVIQLNINYVIGLIAYESIFMANCMNLMRQGLAICLCMVAFAYVIKGKPFRFLLFTYIATTMHVTAWIFLPIYFIRKIKLNKKGIIAFLFVAGVLFLSFETLYTKLSSIIDEAQSFSGDVANNNYNGLTNIIISSAIVIFILYISKQFKNNDLLFIDSQLMLLCALIIYILAIKFSQISRMSLFFMPGLFPILSYVVGYDFKKNRILVTIMIIIGLILYFVVIQKYRPEWAGIVPYSFSF